MSSPECVLITDDHLPHLGGSRIYAHRVATILSGKMAVATRLRPGAASFDAKAAYQISRVHMPGKSFPGPCVAGEAVACAALGLAAGRFKKPQAYLAGEVMPASVCACALAKRHRIPYGIILHDEPLLGAGRLESALRRRVLSGSSAFIVSSSFPARRIREILGDDVKVFVAYPGVDIETFAPCEPDGDVLLRLGLERGRFLLSVGRLVDYKNIEALVRAAAGLPEIVEKVVVVGEGPFKGHLVELTRELSLADRVVFAGRVPQDALVALYCAAFAYVFPSRRTGTQQHEGIGMAALEAAACACPVVASTETSANDFIDNGKTGILFDPELPGALEEALVLLKDDAPGRLRMATACMKLVHSRHTWANTARSVKDALECLKAL